MAVHLIAANPYAARAFAIAVEDHRFDVVGFHEPILIDAVLRLRSLYFMNVHDTREVLGTGEGSVESRDRGSLACCAYCDATCANERAEHGQRTFHSQAFLEISVNPDLHAGCRGAIHLSRAPKTKSRSNLTNFRMRLMLAVAPVKVIDCSLKRSRRPASKCKNVESINVTLVRSMVTGPSVCKEPKRAAICSLWLKSYSPSNSMRRGKSPRNCCIFPLLRN